MKDRPNEYYKMAEVEMNHWWYKSLHFQVLQQLKIKSRSKKIKILDAGCGSGGLMKYLKARGYENMKGFDISDEAVNLCKKEYLKVIKGDLKNIASLYEGERFDAIISNDNLYFIERSEITRFIDDCANLLEPNGLLVINLPCLEIFRGIHDISVGIKKRFSKDEIDKLFNNKQFLMLKKNFWPFLLSPAILLIRFFQRIRIYLIPNTKVYSDISLPSKMINFLFFKITYFDLNYIRYRALGSSILIVMRKNTLKKKT